MTKTNAKNEKKGNNKKLVLVIAIAMLLVATVGATFAYFASRTEINNTLNIVANIEDASGSFIATSSNIELNVTASNMQEKVANTVAATATGNLNVEYYLGKETGLTCQYDINYEWVSDNDTNPYTITNESKNEFTYEISDGTNTIISERNFVASNVRGKQKLGTGYIANASTSEPTRKTYQINAKFYNLEENQSNNANKNWEIKFYVDNIICGVDVESTYTLSGVLLDDNGQPIPNATVVAHSEAKYTTTDSTGAFTITGLEQGNHNIYFIPNKSILEVSQMSDAQIQALPDVKSGTFTTNTTNTIAMSGNYSVGSVNVESNKILKREYPITINYKNTNNETIKESETSQTCTETESYTINPVDINGYITPNSYTGTCGETNVVNFTYAIPVPLNTKIKSLAGTSSSNSDGEWQVLNETVTINNQNYTNTIYTGANPNNYVRYNGEIWRIIGVYNEDTHGKSGQELVKIIRNDSLEDMAWDDNSYKNNWNNAPIKTTLQSAVTDTTSQNMIEEVTWHLGGPDTHNDTTKNTASGYYTYERGTQVYSGNPTTWTGLIGLMYPSDWGYATNGGSTITRSACLGQQMNGWKDGSYYTDCAVNSWLWYVGATSTSKGTATDQWTITPYSSNSMRVFYVSYFEGNVSQSTADYPIDARPVLYLKTGVKTTTGDGSYDNPYQLSM